MHARRIKEARRPVAVAAVRDEKLWGVAARVALTLMVIALALGVLLSASPAGAVDTGASNAAKDAESSAASSVVHVVTPGHGNIDINQTRCYEVPAGETVVADLYTWAQCIKIDGTLDGDIIAGFQDGSVTGKITQDLNGLAETMRITGEVGDDVRFGCETFYLDGHIHGDLIVAGKEVKLSDTSIVDGDVIIACGTATVDGQIGGRVRIYTGFLDFGGTIAGNAEITTDGGMRLGRGARVDGDLVYEGPAQIDVPEGMVGGEYTYHHVQKKDADVNIDFAKGGFLLHFIGFIMAIVAGSIIVALTREHARKTAETIRTKPLKSLGIGFVTYICMPLVLLILLILILTIPLMFVVGLAYAIALYIAKFYVSIWLGNLILGRGGRTDVSPIPSMLLGLLIVYLVTAIPIFGTLVGIVVIFFGLGALLQRKETRLDAAFEAAPAVSNGLPNEFKGTGTGTGA